MFYFAPRSGHRADNARLSVHDADTLSILNGKGVPLHRERRVDRYRDLDARREKRPGVRAEPNDNWGEGSHLVELAAETEYFDNIVAFWRPKEALRADDACAYRYRLTWCQEPPVGRDLATVTQTLTVASTHRQRMQVFYVDFAGTEKLRLCDDFDDFCSDISSNVELSASAGTFVNVAIRRNQIAMGHRVGFEYQPAPGSFQADRRCVLAVNGKPVSEVWLYRWAARG